MAAKTDLKQVRYKFLVGTREGQESILLFSITG